MYGRRKTTQNKNILPLNSFINQLMATKLMMLKKQKVLGIYIDENLRWTGHIDHICANIFIQNFNIEATFHIYPN